MTTHEMLGRSALMGCFAALAVLCAWVLQGLVGSGAKELQADSTVWKEGATDREWATNAAVPVVFKDSPARKWWKLNEIKGLEWFAKVVGEDTIIEDVFQTDAVELLYFNPAMPMAKFEEIAWQPPFRHVQMSAKQLVDFLRKENTTAAESLYFSAQVDREPALKKLNGILVDANFTQRFCVPGTGTCEIHVWMGMDDISARMHYDTYHNFYTQLVGKKEFTLYPPSEWKNLQLFPALHPSARHSQLRFSHLKNKQSSSPLVIVLEPGEVLYLPPFWFHQVRSIGPSLSVNVWSSSEDGLVESVMFNEAVPFVDDRQWTDNQIDAAVFDMVSSILSSDPQGVQILNATLETQFYPLLKPSSRADPKLCIHLLRSVQSLPPTLLNLAQSHALFLSSQLNRISASTRSLSLSNFIQGIANWSFGVPNVVAYLECLLFQVSNLLQSN